MKRTFSYITNESDNKFDDGSIVMHQCIGEGTYGKVYSVTFGKDTSLYAMKIFKYEGIFHNDMPSVIRELLIGGTCSQRHKIVQFVKNGTYGIVSKIGHCTLDDIIQRRVSIDEARMISYKILKKINDIHLLGFMHRDIKPENILLHFSDDTDVDIEIIKSK
jgi:serine/threonine protein kinase